MIRINVTIEGPLACGKTLALKYIEDLMRNFFGSGRSVHYEHQLPDGPKQENIVIIVNEHINPHLEKLR